MDGFRLIFKVIGIFLAIIGAIATAYYAITKFINSTRYFCDDEADFIECECCECEDTENVAQEETEEETAEETTEETTEE